MRTEKVRLLHLALGLLLLFSNFVFTPGFGQGLGGKAGHGGKGGEGGNSIMPGFVQHSDESRTWNFCGSTGSGACNASTINNFTTALPQPTHINNVVIVNVAIAVTATPTGLAVTDDGSNTYTLLSSSASSANTAYVAQFCGVQSAVAQRFTVSSTTNWGTATGKASATEFYNVATGAGGCTSADKTWADNITAASTTLSCGSTTTTSVPNELIHTFAWIDAQSSYTFTTYYPGTGQAGITWNLVPGSGQGWDLMPQEWGVYTKTATINPVMTLSTPGQYVCSGIALKPALSGSPPPSNQLWIAGVQHGAVFSATPNSGSVGPHNGAPPITWQFPNIGNAAAIMFTGVLGGNPVAISSNIPGENWQQAAFYPQGALAGFAAVWYACNLTQSETRQLSFSTNGGTSAEGNTYIFLDIQNALQSQYCLDNGASGITQGNQTVSGQPDVFTTNAFAAANELMVSNLSTDGAGIATQAQTSGVNYLNGGLNIGSTGSTTNQCNVGLAPDPVDECNGMFSAITPSTSAITITANPVSSPIGALLQWATATTAFKPIFASATPPAIPTYTFKQTASNFACATGTTCNVTVASTTANSALVLALTAPITTAVHITSASGGGGTWTTCPNVGANTGCQNTLAAVGYTDLIYNTTGTGGATTLTLNWSASAAGVAVLAFEATCATNCGAGLVIDSPGNVDGNHSSACSTCSATSFPALSGPAADLLIQCLCNVANTASAPSSPYIITADTAWLYALGSINTVNPTFTQTAAGTVISNGIAFKTH